MRRHGITKALVRMVNSLKILFGVWGLVLNHHNNSTACLSIRAKNAAGHAVDETLRIERHVQIKSSNLESSEH